MRRSRSDWVRWGLRRPNSDSSLLIRQGRLGPVSILLYVDDLVIANPDLDEIVRVKLQLVASFDMKDLGDLHYFLGIEVISTSEGIPISQCHNVLSMLFKFGMADSKSISTPLDRTVKLLPDSKKVCDPKRLPDHHLSYVVGQPRSTFSARNEY